MSQDNSPNNHNEVLIKFLAPQKLKHALEELATERNIALSALLRLVTSESVIRNLRAMLSSTTITAIMSPSLRDSYQTPPEPNR